jgi:5-carboxymethyl-2-hydroxymuconate isomerase
MRYRIGNTPDELGEPIGQGPIIAAAVFSFVLGVGFVIAGVRSRHYWLTLWGTGLSLASAAYLAFMLLGR